MQHTKKELRLLVPSLLALLSHVGMAQKDSAQLPPPLQQRVEALLRSRAELPPASILSFTIGGPSEIPGFDKVTVHFASELTKTNGDFPFLISKDGSRLAQFSTYNIAADPRATVPSDGRPARGGPTSAPVLIVNFDDLECPHCANLHRDLFPSITDHYKDQVRIVYQNLPSEGHPWAMRAAIDIDCLGKESSAAYWVAIDAIHAHASEYGGSERKLAQANDELDSEAINEGHRFHVDETELKACIQKQDKLPEQESLRLANTLRVGSTPTFFINGVRFEGELPITFIFDMVDNALRAEGIVPPLRKGR